MRASRLRTRTLRPARRHDPRVRSNRAVTEGRLESLRALLLALGAALIGAAAIVSSLVLFAMQVNVERMPHALFRRLSPDVRLLAASSPSPRHDRSPCLSEFSP